MNASADELVHRLRAELDLLDQDARALRAAGHAKQADECARRGASARRKLERALAGLADRRAAADARAGESLLELVDGIERQLAKCDATSSGGGTR